MTFVDWAARLELHGHTPYTARKAMGLSYVSLLKWRKANHVGVRGEIFLKGLGNRAPNLEAICAERTRDYGDFALNMRNIARYASAITIKIASRNDGATLQQLAPACNFIRYMLALKAHRATFTKDAQRRADSVADFCNYYNLFCDYLRERVASFSIEFREPFAFTKIEGRAKFFEIDKCFN